MDIDRDGFIFVEKDPFIFLDIDYKQCCENIIEKDVITMIYPFTKFTLELIGDSKLDVLYEQCKIDFKRSSIFFDDKQIVSFTSFLRNIKERYNLDEIKKSFVFISQTLYARIVVEIGLQLKELYIGECSDKNNRISYYLYSNDFFMAKKVLRIFGINNSGSDYTIKKIEIVLSCNIVKDEYVSIQINTIE